MRHHLVLDVPDDHFNVDDPWGILGYLTDVYSDPSFIELDDEGGITVTITTGQELVPADTAQLGRTIKALGDGEAIANEIADFDQSRYWGAIELLQAIYEDADIDFPKDTP